MDDDRHLNDISENIGLCRSVDVLYGSASVSTVSSFVTPNRWHRKGSRILCIRTNRILDSMLNVVSAASNLGTSMYLTERGGWLPQSSVVICTLTRRPAETLPLDRTEHTADVSPS